MRLWLLILGLLIGRPMLVASGQTGLPAQDEPGLFVDDPAAGAPAAPTEPGPVSASRALELARLHAADGERLVLAGDNRCVERYYQATVYAFMALTRAPDDPQASGRLAMAVYNHSLGRFLRVASSYGRLRPSSSAHLRTSSGVLYVPIAHEGFPWNPADFSTLLDPGKVTPDRKLQLKHTRDGLGAPTVVVRHGAKTQGRDFLPRIMTFPATAVLIPDLEARDGQTVTAARGDKLYLIDPIRVTSFKFDETEFPLASDLDIPLAALHQMLDADNFRVEGFFNPAKFRDAAGLYMFEPYQPGKIPIVLVHGLASTPWTWSDLVSALRSDPEIIDQYQLWAFIYPTGAGFLESGWLLRQSLYDIVDRYDPNGDDPSLRQMVLIGHSMGGLLSRLQATASEDRIWSAIATQPFDQTRMSRETRDRLSSVLFFEPQPYVKRVIQIASPNRGSHIADALTGRLSSSLVRLPDDTRSQFQELQRENPNLFRSAWRKYPTNVDMLRENDPVLQALIDLPRAPGVPTHTIIGVGKPEEIRGDSSDGVVPVRSARLAGVESERMVPATHGTIHHHPWTVAEVKRILQVHQDGQGAPTVATRSGREPRPSSPARQDRNVTPTALPEPP